eukprot:529663-Rhodomonas_salina.1
MELQAGKTTPARRTERIISVTLSLWSRRAAALGEINLGNKKSHSWDRMCGGCGGVESGALAARSWLEERDSTQSV